MVTTETPTFGVLLSRYRAAVGLTQEELAERAGLSARGIGDLERGVRTRPRGYTVRQIAEALRLSPDDRALFEQAARVAEGIGAEEERLPEGMFLGAVPKNTLVGREEERERIGSAIAAVADGAGQLLLLGGEVGVGKTRLLQEIMLGAQAQGFLVLTGRCSLTEQYTPFYPFVESFSELPARTPLNIRAECGRRWKRISRLISGHALEDASSQDGTVNEQELCGAARDLVLLVACSTPLALLVDDLHWADAKSLKLLHHLARASGNAPILLAGSFCDVHVAKQHPHLARTLQDLGRERLAERIIVRRLSLDETIQLVAATMGQEGVSEEFASFVYRRTRGNPRLIDGLVRSLGGRLELRGEIGAGSMGRVFRAVDRSTRNTVAAKLVLARSAVELDALLRWQQEGAVLAKLEHPHIVRVHDTFADEHASCIIMELVDGQSLGRILQDGPLPLHRARHLATQVADALAYAHAQSIIHRDVKPDNVMVLPDDQVKVTDFGIARLMLPNRSLETVATTGMRMGTPLYMAPEQVEGKKIDGRKTFTLWAPCSITW
jgi:transcriptional regulator with XRE-family HTH domain